MRSVTAENDLKVFNLVRDLRVFMGGKHFICDLSIFDNSFFSLKYRLLSIMLVCRNLTPEKNTIPFHFINLPFVSLEDFLTPVLCNCKYLRPTPSFSPSGFFNPALAAYLFCRPSYRPCRDASDPFDDNHGQIQRLVNFSSMSSLFYRTIS